MNFVGASLLAILQSVQSKSIASKLAPTGVVVWQGLLWRPNFTFGALS